jgi:hypothetical protein
MGAAVLLTAAAEAAEKAVPAQAQKTTAAPAEKTPKLVRFRQGDLWGIYDQNSKKIIINPEYDEILQDAGNHYFRLWKEDGGIIFLDNKGKQISKRRYDESAQAKEKVSVFFFSEGMTIVGLKGKYGFINEKGGEIPCIYDAVEDFKKGRAKVRSGNKSFFIDKEGKIIPTQAPKPVQETVKPPPPPPPPPEPEPPIQPPPAPAPVPEKIPEPVPPVVPNVTTVADSAPTVLTTPSPESEKRWFFEVGPAYWGNSIGFIGGDLRFGYYLRENDRLMLSVGLAKGMKKGKPQWSMQDYYYGEGQTLFGYENYDGIYLSDLWDDELFDVQLKGKIERDIVPIVISWEHEWKLNDKLTLRAGPMIGAAIVSGTGKLNAEIALSQTLIDLLEYYDMLDEFNAEVSPEEIYSKSLSSVAVLFGLSVGVRYDFIKEENFNLYADVSIFAFGSTDVKFRYNFQNDFLDGSHTDRVNLSGARITFSIGARF